MLKILIMLYKKKSQNIENMLFFKENIMLISIMIQMGRVWNFVLCIFDYIKYNLEIYFSLIHFKNEKNITNNINEKKKKKSLYSICSLALLYISSSVLNR